MKRIFTVSIAGLRSLGCLAAAIGIVTSLLPLTAAAGDTNRQVLVRDKK